METVISFLQTSARPHQITFERDPRWVGSVSGRDFPAPLRRLLLCLGITPSVGPPHRPDRHAYVERSHRTYGQECLQLHRPSTLQEVREVTEAFLKHYNEERPHQGRTCGNVPPRVAFPRLPPLPALAIRGLIQMPGERHWIRTGICVMWGAMAASTSICPPPPSVLRWPGGRSYSRW
jgi:hypothetical protein